MLKQIRKVHSLNNLLRNGLIKLKAGFSFIEKSVYPRWRVAGKIKLKINGVYFLLYSECDDFLADTLFYGVNDEKTELTIFSEFAKSSRTILDIGANTGLYSVVASRVNPMSAVFSFEPYPVNLNRLRKNISLNNSINIIPFKYAVGSENKAVELAVPSENRICQVSSLNSDFSRNFFSGEVTFKNIEVPCKKLDSIVDDSGLTNIDLIKIDVELHEVEVFKGGIKTIQKYKPIIFCEVLVDEERKRYFDETLSVLGYTIYLVTPLGLIKLDRMEKANFRTFLFSPKSSEDRFLSVIDLEKIAHILAPSQNSK